MKKNIKQRRPKVKTRTAIAFIFIVLLWASYTIFTLHHNTISSIPSDPKFHVIIQAEKEYFDIVSKWNPPTLEEEQKTYEKNPWTPTNNSFYWGYEACNPPFYPDSCFGAIILNRQKVSFCAPAKTASTTIKFFFLQVADGDVMVPKDAKYPVHQANWTTLLNYPVDLRRDILLNETKDRWTNVVFMKNVVYRFISGYLDKVVRECSLPYNPGHVFHHYDPHGFNCTEHKDFEKFLIFMESLPAHYMEGHFKVQTSVCDMGKYPYTEFLYVDDKFSKRLQTLGKKLGVQYIPDKKTSNHSTGSGNKVVDVLKGKKSFLYRILELFEEDCIFFPKSCDVDGILKEMDGIK